jgi:hypothetical protein
MVLFSNKDEKPTFGILQKVAVVNPVVGPNPLRTTTVMGFFMGDITPGDCLIFWSKSLTGYGIRFVQTSPVKSVIYYREADTGVDKIDFTTENSKYTVQVFPEGEVPEVVMESYKFFMGEDQ